VAFSASLSAGIATTLFGLVGLPWTGQQNSLHNVWSRMNDLRVFLYGQL